MMHRRSGIRRWLALLLLLLLLAPLPQAAAVSVDDILNMARMGGADLAVRMLEERQQKLEPTDDEWMRLERERLEIHRQGEDWAAITRRVAALPDGLPGRLRNEAFTLKAEAWLRRHDGAAARRVLRTLLWDPEIDAGDVDTARWRRMVIRSYLADRNYPDADITIQRYRHDYGGDEPELRRWQGRVLLNAGRPADAIELLTGLEHAEARLLLLRARLAAREAEPAAILAEAREFAAQGDLQPLLSRDGWLVSAQAAARASEPEQLIAGWEQALARSFNQPAPETMFTPPVNPWQAYLTLGTTLGNEAGLVIGEDAGWFARVEARAGEVQHQRALLAVVAWRSPDAAASQRAHRMFIDSFGDDDAAVYTVNALYREAPLPAGETPPAWVYHHLVDALLDRGEIGAASGLARHLEQPPEGGDRVEWDMRRARVLVLAGDVPAGAEVLAQLLDEVAEVPSVSLDRLMQVLFDMQALGYHERSLALFEAVLDLGVSRRQRREIMFWKAESYSELDEHEEAARHYLISAVLDDPAGGSQWAQAARFHAAEALVEAGMLADAARMYRQLLRTADDPSRRAVLGSALQRVEAQLRDHSRGD